MEVNYQLIDPVADERQWDALLSDFPDATFFHTSAWASTLVGAYSFKPFYYVWFDKEKPSAIIPVMQTRTLRGKRRGVSLPFSDSSEPLLNKTCDFRAAFERLVQIGRENRWNFIEIRGGKRFFGAESAFQTIYSHDIDLRRDEKTIFKSFRDSTQRNIRAAERSGIEIVHSTSLDAQKNFCRLNYLTRREHGLPPQPWSFFHHLWSAALKQEKGFIIGVFYHGKAIAASLYLISGKKAIYKYGASDRRYQHLRPSNLVMWEGLKQCREKGCISLNLGRTETQHEGLLRFKRGFGCEETTVNYYRYDLLSNRFVGEPDTGATNGLSSRIMTRLPLFILRFVGNVLYKYAG